MKLLTKAIETKLRANVKAQAAVQGTAKEIDHIPVVKFFTPDGGATWLITELIDNDTLFGLCDLGLGTPELGYVSLSELQSLRGRLGLPVERDRFFKTDKPLSHYTNRANVESHINA